MFKYFIILSILLNLQISFAAEVNVAASNLKKITVSNQTDKVVYLSIFSDQGTDQLLKLNFPIANNEIFAIDPYQTTHIYLPPKQSTYYYFTYPQKIIATWKQENLNHTSKKEFDNIKKDGDLGYIDTLDIYNNYKLLNIDGIFTVQPIANTIRIANTTGKDIFLALYQSQKEIIDLLPNSELKLHSNIISIGTNEAVSYGIPPQEILAQGLIRNSYKPQIIVFSSQKNLIKDLLSSDEILKNREEMAYQFINSSINKLQIKFENSKLTVAQPLSSLEVAYETASAAARSAKEAATSAAESISGSMSEILNKITPQLRDVILKEYMSNRPAQVILTDKISNAEENFINHRKKTIFQAIKWISELRNLTPSDIPNIGLCFTGGGMRAMIGTLGVLSAANNKAIWTNPNKFSLEPKYNLLDACAYMSALSGSTWALSSWLMSQLELADYIKIISSKLDKNLEDLSDKKISLIVEQILKKWAFGQNISAIDIYGGLLTQKLLSSFENVNPNAITIDQLSNSKKIINLSVPLPMLTAVEGTQYPYQWFEITPFSVNLLPQKNYIEPFAFGRKFNNTKSVDFAPAQSLGYCLGIFGSAYTFAINDVLNKESIFENILLDLIKKLSILPKELEPLAAITAKNIIKQSFYLPQFIAQHKEKRFYPAQVNNWNLGLKEAGALTNVENLTLIDAGIDFNFPVPPLLKKSRNVNIIILVDLGENIDELQKVAQYALINKLPFPKLPNNYKEQILKSNCVVFSGEITEPTIIYIKALDNPNNLNLDFTSTLNFAYTQQQFEILSQLAEKNFTSCIPKIIETINKLINLKSRS